MDLQTLPQPPPGVPAPSAGPEARRSKCWMKAIIWMGVGSVTMMVLAGLVAPLVLRAAKKAPSTQALSNARQIGLALFDFESDYGKFPDASTIADVKSATGTTWHLKDDTSNDLLKQLIAAGITTSEEIFFARIFGSKKPDNVIASNRQTLARGQCGFAYILGGGSKSDPARPLIVSPLIPGTLLFDPQPFEGKAVVLRPDNSAVTLKIQPDGRVLGLGGKDIFDPSQPYWGGVAPVVKWADLPSSPPPVPQVIHDSSWLVTGLICVSCLMMLALWKMETSVKRA